MKSASTFLIASTASLLWATGLLAQNVAPAVSLGDPIPSQAIGSPIVLVNNSACNSCGVKLAFQPSCETAKACAGGCRESVVSVACPGDCKTTGCSACTPACAIAAKPAPCKACDAPKHFHRITTPCSTCAQPASCATCVPAAKPASAPCPCAAKHPILHRAPAAPACASCAVAKTHAPVACSTCAVKATPCATCAPKAVACPVAPKVCDSGCPKAAAPCTTSDPCKAHSPRAAHSRPILDAIKNLFGSHGHQQAAPPCSTCTATAPTTAAPLTTTSSYQPTERTMQSVQNPEVGNSLAPVPAAFAPYAPQAPFSTATPIDSNPMSR